MRSRILGKGWTCILILSSTLSGCAAFSEWGKCGYDGCPADAKITADVEQRLNQYPDLAAPSAVYVQTVKGVVYLHGEVTTDIQRDTAMTVAQTTPGVRQVVDVLTVRATFGR